MAAELHDLLGENFSLKSRFSDLDLPRVGREGCGSSGPRVKPSLKNLGPNRAEQTLRKSDQVFREL